ncbi:S-adenosyl-L-methionine-dependent methyltransferase [Aspergillus karnatakaensis]|uniref:S-adenosyl-L-methionine-dependent methyltransferase n=1 Tax=Aspergillus karnatakaensis TaxID=1810916 RepID=UPI003CCCA482
MDRFTLKERAAAIFEKTNSLADELAQTGHAEPSFEHGPPAPLQANAPESSANMLRHDLLEMVDELHTLLIDPVYHSSPELRNPTLSVHPIIRLGIAEHFPEKGTTVKDLAVQLGLREALVRRLLTHSATYHVYYETKPDFFVHTAASRVLAENDGLRAWFLVGAEELLPASHKTSEALLKYPDSEEPHHSGWSLQNNTDKAIFQVLPSSPDRAALFARAMTWINQPGFSPQYLVDTFPWSSDPDGDYTVVDIGGGLGHVTEALAAQKPKVQYIVQDTPGVIEHAKIQQVAHAAEPNERRQITFEAHDFFNDQPVHGADVYLVRLVLHDWSDKYAQKILRALIPALKPGAKVVINDRIMPGHHQVHYLTERLSRDHDMYMMAFQNARERTVDDWKALVKETDPRFELTAIHQPARSVLGVIEATWRG